MYQNIKIYGRSEGERVRKRERESERQTEREKVIAFDKCQLTGRL